MALSSNLNRPLYRYLRCIGPNIYKPVTYNFHNKTISFETDCLDDFISHLVQKKANEWSAQQITQKWTNRACVKNSCGFDHGDIGQLNLEQINYIFQQSVELEDNAALLDLVSQCLKYYKCPSLSIIVQVLSICAQNGDTQVILRIKEMFAKFHPQTLRANSDFQHYLAEAIWVKGNISEALRIFKNVYEENAYLRRKIKLAFKYLILEVPSSRSEAVLISIVKFGQDILDKYKDFFPLVCIWEVCFISEWYTDQCLALDLLEKNYELLNAVVSRIPYVVSTSLHNHQIETVYRLLEVLLKYKLKTQYSGVLLALLDYQVKRGDIQRCSEIIHWSIKHNVELPAIHHEKFLNLLLRYNIAVDKMESSTKGKVNTNYRF